MASDFTWQKVEAVPGLRLRGGWIAYPKQGRGAVFVQRRAQGWMPTLAGRPLSRCHYRTREEAAIAGRDRLLQELRQGA